MVIARNEKQDITGTTHFVLLWSFCGYQRGKGEERMFSHLRRNTFNLRTNDLISLMNDGYSLTPECCPDGWGYGVAERQEKR